MALAANPEIPDARATRGAEFRADMRLFRNLISR